MDRLEWLRAQAWLTYCPDGSHFQQHAAAEITPGAIVTTPHSREANAGLSLAALPLPSAHDVDGSLPKEIAPPGVPSATPSVPGEDNLGIDIPLPLTTSALRGTIRGTIPNDDVDRIPPSAPVSPLGDCNATPAAARHEGEVPGGVRWLFEGVASFHVSLSEQYGPSPSVPAPDDSAARSGEARGGRQERHLTRPPGGRRPLPFDAAAGGAFGSLASPVAASDGDPEPPGAVPDPDGGQRSAGAGGKRKGPLAADVVHLFFATPGGPSASLSSHDCTQLAVKVGCLPPAPGGDAVAHSETAFDFGGGARFLLDAARIKEVVGGHLAAPQPCERAASRASAGGAFVSLVLDHVTMNLSCAPQGPEPIAAEEGVASEAGLARLAAHLRAAQTAAQLLPPGRHHLHPPADGPGPVELVHKWAGHCEDLRAAALSAITACSADYGRMSAFLSALVGSSQEMVADRKRLRTMAQSVRDRLHSLQMAEQECLAEALPRRGPSSHERRLQALPALLKQVAEQQDAQLAVDALASSALV